MKIPDPETPYDHPRTIWERLTFPSLRDSFLDGWFAGSTATVNDLIELGFQK